MKQNNKKGLTLIELLAVIAIIAILFVLLIPQVNSAINKARIVGVQTDLRSYQIAAQSYFMENQSEAKTVEDYNEYLDKDLQFVNGKSKELNPWGEPYEVLSTTDGLNINVKTEEDESGGIDNVEYSLELSEVNGQFISETKGFDEPIVTDNTPEIVQEACSVNPNPTSDFEIEILTEGIQITHYKGTSSDVVIPCEINGQPVVEISSALNGSLTSFSNKNLTSVVIPNTVTFIGYNAFSQNNLTSINLPTSLKKIDYGAFAKNSLTSIVFPSKLEEIGEESFVYNEFTSITFPSTLQYIGSYSFYNIPTLNTIINCSLLPLNNLTNSSPDIISDGC